MNSERLCAFGICALLLGVLALASFQMLTVEALVPSIVSVDSYEVGSTAWVEITVNHTPPPTIGSGHYVSSVQVDVNGAIQALPQTPQSENTFTVQYSLGPVSEVYEVRARALCTVHGYSSWSSQVTIPEISLLTVVLLMTLTVIMIFISAKKLNRHTSAQNCMNSNTNRQAKWGPRSKK